LYAAQEAFVAFAEMTAYRYSQKLENSVVLAKTSLKNDEKIASLLFSLLESDKLEKKLQKDATRWLLLQDQNEGAIPFFK
jgi:thiamine kinase-like enzyme